ncbi:hypothetical protein SH467x_003209 [Pirellulaceae bacterium SH467]|jgi:hypothetical protein
MKCIISCFLFTIVITVQNPESELAVVNQQPPNAPTAPAPPLLEDPSSSPVLKSTDEKEAVQVDAPKLDSPTSKQPLDKLILPVDAPDWVRAPQITEGELRFAIPTATAEDLEQCYEEFESQLLSEVQRALDAHVLRYTSASQLDPLTKKYIEDHWLVQNCEYDQVIELPSGTYHQLWKQIYISKDQIAVIRSWEERALLSERIVKVGALGGVSIGGMLLLSGMVGVLARRESRKLKA